MGERELGPHLTQRVGPRPNCMPSFILIRPTVWPQYNIVTHRQTDRQTGQTDRQTVRQRSDSIGRTVLQTVAQKLFALCYQTVVCPVCPVLSCSVCLSVTLVYCGQTVGYIQMKLGMQVDGDPAPPPTKGHSPLIFSPYLFCYGQGGPWSRPQCARWGPSSPPRKTGQSPQFSADFCCGQTAQATLS